MKGLHENQKKILEYLLGHNDGATLEDLSDHLGLSKTAAKEHLLRIDGLGFIRFEDKKGLIGRPKRHYFLSQEGQEAFPRQYSWLSNSLLKMLTRTMGQEGVGALMEYLAEDVANSFENRLSKARSLKERLNIINKIMNELGYHSSIKQRDFRKGAVIEATNCVYHNVAKNNPELCRFDTQFIKYASGGMDVKLETCISRGDLVCRFCLKRENK